MRFLEEIERLSKDNIVYIYVDMDGVIADYDFGRPFDFLNKRPLISNINFLKELTFNENIILNILSVCRTKEQIDEKNKWLDKYAPFFKNRNIIPREENNMVTSSILKQEFLKKLDKNKINILIDDDNLILKEVSINVPNIILFQDSSIVK